MNTDDVLKYQMDDDSLSDLSTRKVVPDIVLDVQETTPTLGSSVAPLSLASTVIPLIAPENKIDIGGNKKLAENHIKDTLSILSKSLAELSEFAPETQRATFYQTIGLVAKEIIEGSIRLTELRDEESIDPAPTKTVNNLNVTLTSGQLNDIFKKARITRDD